MLKLIRMNKKTVIIRVVCFALLILTYGILKKGNELSGKNSSYYLTSPWVTERVDWFFISLPEKWKEDLKELNKGKAKYDEISNEVHIYGLEMNNFFLVCTYMDAKDGIYQNWDLDKSANAMINRALYNLKCKDIDIEKLPSIDNFVEVNYLAFSNCNIKYKARLKGTRYQNHILVVCLYYMESDPNLEIIAERILNSIENKYPNVTNTQN